MSPAAGLAATTMARFPTARQVLCSLLTLVVLCIAPSPAPVSADGLLEAINRSNEETIYSHLSTKTTDVSGATTRLETTTYVSRSNLQLNYNFLPNLNLDAGGTYEKNLSKLSLDKEETDTTITLIRPHAWLTLRDPVLEAAVGYDLVDDTVETSGQSTALIRETYNGNLLWRPLDLPSTQFRYTRTLTHDGNRTVLDTILDQYYLKSEYLYQGLNVSYVGNLLKTRDNIQNADSTLISHEAKLLYATTFLDGRISVTTDNRLFSREITTNNPASLGAFGSAFLIQQPAAAGLSTISNTVTPITLTANPALIDGDITTSAGLDIGSSQSGGLRRQVGLDLGSSPVAVARLLVWVTGFGSSPPPPVITSSFTWDIYTSTDNFNWTLYATAAPATFGPFDFRFQIDFPTTTTRFIKAVTAPLNLAVPGAASFPNIFITEVQAFDTGTLGAGGTAGRTQTITQTQRSHRLEVKTILFRTPSLYHRFTGEYEEFDSPAESRYLISNGLFLTHRLTPILTANANTTFEVGKERDGTSRTGLLYYASLGATPLKTLTDSLVFSGNNQRAGSTTTTNNALVLYNTAQLYAGFDATLNLGAVLTSNDQGAGMTLRSRQYFVTVGTGITPNPRLTLNTYYTGKLTQTSGGEATRPPDTTDHRLDLGLLLTPFRAIVISATASIESQTGQPTQVTQNYGLSWTPFPDGSLQFSLTWTQSRFPEQTQSEIIQPTLRWYLGPSRRSYVEGTYQNNTAKTSTSKTESQLFSATLNIYYH